MRLGTFNIMNGRSLADGLVDGERGGEAIAGLDTDGLGLQEADRAQLRSGPADLTRIAAVVVTPIGRVTIATTHLSLVPGWNVRQLHLVRRALRAMPAPRILLADLNLPGGLPRLFSGWHRLATMATYPSPAPRVQFD